MPGSPTGRRPEEALSDKGRTLLKERGLRHAAAVPR